jgi:hypothetical protein
MTLHWVEGRARRVGAAGMGFELLDIVPPIWTGDVALRRARGRTGGGKAGIFAGE